jgi:hypothetical protein
MGVLVGVLGACGDGGESGDDRGPGTIPTGTATTTRTPSAPTDPKAAERAEVEAAVRAYYEAMDVAFRTGDTEPFKRITTATCNCRALVEGVREVFDGGRTRGASVRFDRMDEPRLAGKTIDIETWATVTAYEILNARGQVTDRSDGQDGKRLIGLVQTDAGLRVADVVYLGAA